MILFFHINLNQPAYFCNTFPQISNENKILIGENVLQKNDDLWKFVSRKVAKHGHWDIADCILLHMHRFHKLKRKLTKKRLLAVVIHIIYIIDNNLCFEDLMVQRAPSLPCLVLPLRTEYINPFSLKLC